MSAESSPQLFKEWVGVLRFVVGELPLAVGGTLDPKFLHPMA
ncbi:MAG TPA: hypothetical protein VMV34_01740 [Terriglobia bacterium]|nr:hypothetical protein [Terriglobia bacterium]